MLRKYCPLTAVVPKTGCAIQCFINFIPHMLLNICYSIFFSVQLILSPIHGLFLSIMGDALADYTKPKEAHF